VNTQASGRGLSLGNSGRARGRNLTKGSFAVAVLVLSVLVFGGYLPSLGSSATAPASIGNASGAPESPTGSAAPATGSTAGEALPAAIDACGLMTPAEASAIVGGPAPAREQLPVGGWVASQCSWKSPIAGFLVSVGTPESIKAFADPAGPDAEAKIADYRQRAVASGGARDVAGIGDDAAISASGLAARIGGYYVEILRSTLTDDQLIEVAKGLVQDLH
jgi:hypothetical protein